MLDLSGGMAKVMGTLSVGPVCVSVSPVAMSVGNAGCCLTLAWLGMLTYPLSCSPVWKRFLRCEDDFPSPSTVCSMWLLYLPACQSADPSSPKLQYLEIMQMASSPKYLSVKLSLQEVSQLTLSSEQGGIR